MFYLKTKILKLISNSRKNRKVWVEKLSQEVKNFLTLIGLREKS